MVDLNITTPAINSTGWAPPIVTALNTIVADANRGKKYVIPEDHGVIGDGATNNTAAWVNAVNEAATTGREILIAGGKSYVGTITATDVSLRIRGEGGKLLAPAGTTGPISVTHNLGDPVVVSSIAETLIGPASSKTTPPSTERSSQAVVPAADLNKFRADATWGVLSRDAYEWSTNPGLPGGNRWKAEMFPVLGVAFAFTPTGAGAKENDTIVGSTSGATGMVGSYAPTTYSSSVQSSTVPGKVILKWLTGTFQVNETVTVGGTVVGTITADGTVLMKGTLRTTFSTSIEIRKLRSDLEVSISGVTLGTVGDPDTLVGFEARPDALTVAGAVTPRITGVVFENAWSSAAKIASCSLPIVDIVVNRAANNATMGGAESNQPKEQGYGYGIEVLGFTNGGTFKINGRNLRHAFTTNTNAYPTYPTTLASLLLTGTPVDNLVHDSFASNCWGPAFDTHDGANFTTFRNCTVRNTAGGFRHFSGVAGFQNRSNNTSYYHCRSIGSVHGFIDTSGNGIASTPTTTTYMGCVAERFHYTGFRIANAATSAVYRVVMEGCRSRGDGSSSTYSSVGYKIAGCEIEITNCTAERFSSAAIELTEPGTIATTAVVRGFLADFREASLSTAGSIKVGGATAQTLVLDRLDIMQRPTTPAMPAAAVTIVSGSPAIRWGTDPQILNTANTVARYVVSAGTPTHARITTATTPADGTQAGSGSGGGAAVPTSTVLPDPATAPSRILTWDGVGTADAQGRKRADETVWTYDLGWGIQGWGNFESQKYTDSLDNVYCKDGLLHITAIKLGASEGNGAITFASGRLTSRNKVSVPVGAYVETRLKAPRVPASWSAFWMMGDGTLADSSNWPRYGEIDIFEGLGANPDTVGHAAHQPIGNAAGPTQTAPPYTNSGYGWTDSLAAVQDVSRPINDWHYYGVLRTATSITWYIDRVPTLTLTKAIVEARGGYWPHNQGAFLLLNLAIGGLAAGPDATAFVAGAMPIRMLVEPVKIWNGGVPF